MSSDKKTFKRSVAKWESLKEDEAFSAPTKSGTVAIFCGLPKLYLNASERYKKAARKDSKVYRKEAMVISKRLGESGLKTEIIYNPQTEDFTNVVEDPDFSSVVTIGDGSFVDYALTGDDGDVDWLDLSIASDHLKTGPFLQRHCGHFSRSFNVPLGTFLVSNPSHVIAPVGHYFNPRGLNHPDNALLIAPLAEIPMNYEVIKSHFSDGNPIFGQQRSV